MNRLQEKVVWITGASSGIGYACAKEFIQLGCKVVIGARRVERLAKLEQEASSGTILKHSLDVCSGNSIQAFCDTAYQAWGAPDILVNNAGLVIGTDPIANGKEDHWQTIFDTNVLGVLRMSQAALQYMKPRKSGHIIFIGSIAGHQVYEGGGPYCASKHGVKAIYKTLKLELNGTGIRISSIDPGMVETEFSIVRLGSKKKADKVYEGLTPLTAVDIAESVVFVASRPDHVNIDNIIIMPTAQASVHKVHRNLPSDC